MKYIIGNWKSNKSESEILDWFDKFAGLFKQSGIRLGGLEIVICPPLIYLSLVRRLVEDKSLPLAVGAQNISAYPEGAYTGEVTGKMISDYARCVIVGHSERRNYFREDDNELFKKTELAAGGGLSVIYCIPDAKTEVPDDAEIIAYEPVFAIGTGQADTPENADKVGGIVKQKYPGRKFIYGGSVNNQNVSQFLQMSSIDGVLPGKASLDPRIFWEMIANAAKI